MQIRFLFCYILLYASMLVPYNTKTMSPERIKEYENLFFQCNILKKPTMQLALLLLDTATITAKEALETYTKNLTENAYDSIKTIITYMNNDGKNISRPNAFFETEVSTTRNLILELINFWTNTILTTFPLTATYTDEQKKGLHNFYHTTLPCLKNLWMISIELLQTSMFFNNGDIVAFRMRDTTTTLETHLKKILNIT